MVKGVVPGKQKHIIHLRGFDQGIVDLNTVIRSDLTILDGIVGMEGTAGPTNGRAVKMDVIVAGDNVVEVDSVGTRMMGSDPTRAKHVGLASEQALGALDGFEMLGDSLGSVAAHRDLPRIPGFNKLLITGIGVRAINLARDSIMHLTGGERVARTARLGDLVIDAGLCDGCLPLPGGMPCGGVILLRVARMRLRGLHPVLLLR